MGLGVYGHSTKHGLDPKLDPKFRAFFKNSSVGGGEGIYKKGPYYTECGEMIDGLLVIKSLV